MAGVDVEADMSGLFVGEEQGSLFPEDDQAQDAGTQMNSTANMNVTDVGEKKKRVIKNPQPKLNAERLMGPRGIHTIEELFKDWKPTGPGKEFEDLDVIMHKLNHWAHRLYPKLPFDDTLDIIANRLGNKKMVTTHVKKIRMGMLVNPVREEEREVVDGRDEEEEEREVERYDGNAEPEIDQFRQLAAPAASSHSSPGPRSIKLTEDQLDRMKRNKEIAGRKKKEREEARRKEEEEDELMRDLEEERDPEPKISILNRLELNQDTEQDGEKNTPRISRPDVHSLPADNLGASEANSPIFLSSGDGPVTSAAAAVEWEERSELYVGPSELSKGEKQKEKRDEDNEENGENVLTIDEIMEQME